MIEEGELLWEPERAFIERANVRSYIDWLRQRDIVDCADYQALWRWSVTETEAFWGSLWHYFDIRSDTPPTRVLDQLEMRPGGRWFIGSRVNFAEHIVRNDQGARIAIHSRSEHRGQAGLSWSDLGSRVRILATRLRAMGVSAGDPVACLMPSLPETVIAMLATISIGAVWSNAAPEFGQRTVLDRFSQFRPKVLFVCDGYQFGGKVFSRDPDNAALVAALSASLVHVVHLPYLGLGGKPGYATLGWEELLAGDDPGPDRFHFERVPHDHPLWVVFSSGTTGLPKAIVHSHVGALLEMKKFMTFHMNLTPADTSFFFTTTGWVMFNLQVGMMLTGASAVLYDGNPAWPGPEVLWQLAAETGATFFGASPTFVQLMEKQGIEPGQLFDLSALRGILVGGAPCSPATFAWFYKAVKDDLWVTSQSGGTEIVSGFVGAIPTQPVYAAEIQTRLLGMDVDAWDEQGNTLVDAVGELVVKTPFPSMPLYFLGDEDGSRYRASYFEDYPGVWRHGDFIKINSRGGCYIYGRSDATLNRYGVRIGTAEIYGVVESISGIEDSLVVCVELPGGEFFMPMFLQLAPATRFDDELLSTVQQTLKRQCSPRHVPDRFYVVPEIPYTLTGKKLEVPVRKLLLGWPLDKVVSLDATRNPAAMDYFVEFVASTTDYAVPPPRP